MANPEMKLPVDHVSDTAYLVAMYRSYESERPDAKFQDPYAAILSAPKKEWLEKTIPFHEEGRWFMTIRTCLLDRHIQRLVAEGTDTVVNLAAGLDSRPYRMDLPKTLRWIEADFPAITEYKADRLLRETPTCRLDRIKLDLTDVEARRRLFADVESSSKQTLVITEGLLPYLDDRDVDGLARELHGLRAITHWAMDIATPAFFDVFKDRWDDTEPKKEVSLKFAPVAGPHYFERHGWKVDAFESFLAGSEELNYAVPEPMRKLAAASESGIALLSKAR